MTDSALSTTLVALALALVVVAGARLSAKRSQLRSLPPGPPSRLLGGTPIPSQHPWRKFKEYTDEYGDLVTLWGANGKPLFVCGTATSADAILQKNSAATADRPHLIMAGDLISGGKRILILRHGERWRKYRRILHEALNTTAAKSYEPVQESEAAITAAAIGRRPETFRQQFERYAASVIMTVAYDHPVTTLNDPLVEAVKGCLSALGTWINPAASPLDSWPLLRFVPAPLNPWKREGKRLHREELALFLGVYQNVRTRAAEGKARGCFATQLQEQQERLGLTDDEACYVAGSLFGAGSDTTVSALAILVMALITHPEAMRSSQAELDRVVGSSRLPTFADYEDLPYVRALCQEVARWRPVSSGGFQHALTDDVVYKGWVLPKGSAVVGNHWSIHLDPKEYPEPDVFKPERFLDEAGRVVGTWFSPRGHYQFGFGRRVCVGLNVAERSIFINAAMLLWAFDFRAPDGRIDLVDTLAFTSAANSHPLPFEAGISYRSEQHRKTLEQACAIGS